MYSVVLVTTKNVTEAKKIAGVLLEAKLIACANIVKGAQSLFWWDGRIDKSNEALLILKSKKSLFTKIVQTVKSVHSYDVPEIIALPVIGGYNPYLKWIDCSTRKKR